MLSAFNDFVLIQVYMQLCERKLSHAGTKSYVLKQFYYVLSFQSVSCQGQVKLPELHSIQKVINIGHLHIFLIVYRQSEVLYLPHYFFLILEKLCQNG